MCLLVVDMQRYYLEDTSPFFRYTEHRYPGAMSYIARRCRDIVIPNLIVLLTAARRRHIPIVYLKLCGEERDRGDLHPSFRRLDEEAVRDGFGHVYPRDSEPLSDIIPALAPKPNDRVLRKTTFSGFTSSNLDDHLRQMDIGILLTTGLATSQCVETTARDAADRGYRIVHVEDAQADYSRDMHRASLHASQGVCGGEILKTARVIRMLARE